MTEVSYQVYSMSDGWEIQKLQGNKVVAEWVWGHEDFEEGVGGELLFSKILKDLGFRVYQEEVY